MENWKPLEKVNKKFKKKSSGPFLEEPSLLWILEDPVDEELLVDLAVVDLLLDGP